MHKWESSRREAVFGRIRECCYSFQPWHEIWSALEWRERAHQGVTTALLYFGRNETYQVRSKTVRMPRRDVLAVDIRVEGLLCLIKSHVKCWGVQLLRCWILSCSSRIGRGLYKANSLALLGRLRQEENECTPGLRAVHGAEEETVSIESGLCFRTSPFKVRALLSSDTLKSMILVLCFSYLQLK